MLQEFSLAQANLLANIANGGGAQFRYQGAGTGTFPLPILFGYFTGQSPANAGACATPATCNTLYASEYQAPINDGMGAKFIFPRIVDEKKFLNPESGSVRFISEVTGQIKLNVTFKTSEMIYNGQLEY